MARLPMEMDPSSAVREGEMPMSIEIDGETKYMTPSEIRALETGSDASPTLTPNPNSDIKLVEDLMRTIDPRSVVREGEVNQALATGGAADSLLPLLESLKNGTKLSDENRESILFQIQSLDPRSTVREGEMPMMGEEDKNLFMSLMNKGIPEDMIIDIMADSKVPVMGGGGMDIATSGMINPAEFGGLPKTGSSPASGNPSMQTSPATGNPTGMNQNDMAMYLQNKVSEIKGRTGGSQGLGALSGVNSKMATIVDPNDLRGRPPKPDPYPESPYGIKNPLNPANQPPNIPIKTS